MTKLINNLRVVLLVALLISSASSIAGDQRDLSHEDLSAWLKGYEEAWESLDADKAAKLFAEDATYKVDPYSDAHQGREGIHAYWAGVTADQKDVEFTFEVLAVTGNTGIAHWHSEFTQASSGTNIILDGIFVLEFSQDRLCQSLKEWWGLKVDPE